MVTVFTKDNCVQCTPTKRKLVELGVPFREVNVTEDESALEHIKSLGYLAVPVVETPDGEHWQGFIPDRLAALVA